MLTGAGLLPISKNLFPAVDDSASGAYRPHRLHPHFSSAAGNDALLWAGTDV
jgi:hypothetical protein